MELISVIITAYNCEHYIDKCIASAVNQTYSLREIVIINDGSIDDTWQKIEEWSQREPGIIVIDSENNGVVIARKKALEKVSGKYLTFLDGDDYLPNDALEKLLFALKEKSADIVLGSYTLVWEKTGIHTTVNKPKNFTTVDGCIAYCLKNGETFIPIKLYKTALFRTAVNIPKHLILQEDTIGTVQYLKLAQTATYTNANVYYYRKYEGTASSCFGPKHRKSLVDVCLLLRELLATSAYPHLQQSVDCIVIGNVYNCLRHRVADKKEEIVFHHILSSVHWHNLPVDTIGYQMTLKVIICRLYHYSPLLGIFAIKVSNASMKFISNLVTKLCHIFR